MTETTPKNEMTFESSLEALQKAVRTLETGELSLEEALKTFEEGVKLTRSCQEHLGQAEKRIQILLQNPSTQKQELEDFKPTK